MPRLSMFKQVGRSISIMVGSVRCELHTLPGQVILELGSYFPQPSVPMVLDPRGDPTRKDTPLIPNDQDPKYLSAARTWAFRTSVMEVAASLGVEANGLTLSAALREGKEAVHKWVDEAMLLVASIDDGGAGWSAGDIDYAHDKLLELSEKSPEVISEKKEDSSPDPDPRGGGPVNEDAKVPKVARPLTAE